MNENFLQKLIESKDIVPIKVDLVGLDNITIISNGEIYIIIPTNIESMSKEEYEEWYNELSLKDHFYEKNKMGKM